MANEKLVRDLKPGDIVLTSTGAKTIQSIHPYGTSYHSLVLRFENDNRPYTEDKLTSFEVLN